MRLITLLVALAVVEAQTQFRSHDSLKDAVNLWCTNATLARGIYGSIGSWDVSRVTNMRLLFNDKYDFNDDISTWDVSRVTTMVRLHAVQAHPFSESRRALSSRTCLQNHMFDNARSFNVNISGWDVSHVEEMYAMFNGAGSFNQDLSRWDLRAHRGEAPMRHMFRDCHGLSECNKARMNAAFAVNSKWPCAHPTRNRKTLRCRVRQRPLTFRLDLTACGEQTLALESPRGTACNALLRHLRPQGPAAVDYSQRDRDRVLRLAQCIVSPYVRAMEDIALACVCLCATNRA